MSIRISPALKGLITAVIMVAVFLVAFKTNRESGSSLQYIVYGIYGLGITWTLLAYRQSASFTGKFTDLFSQGFRCFIIVTLCITFFYWLFNYMHPEFKEEMAAKLKKQLTVSKDKMPLDIENDVAAFKKQYAVSLISRAIFGYLIIGAGITAAMSALLTKRK
ncbi:MAG: DUF4199 domain-containing protein [Bacteroidota bacterium]